MAEQLPDIDDLSIADLKRLLLEALAKIAELTAENAALREEIARLKGLKGRPAVKPSRPSGMEGASSAEPAPASGKRRRGRPARMAVEDRVLTLPVPAGSRFKGYESYLVQDLEIRARAIRYRRARWLTPDGSSVVAPLPAGTAGHFGPELRRFVLAQYHQGQVTVPRLVEQLRGFGLAISSSIGAPQRRRGMSWCRFWIVSAPPRSAATKRGRTRSDTGKAEVAVAILMRRTPRISALIFYADLTAYCRDPTAARKAALRVRFDRTCRSRTAFANLDRQHCQGGEMALR